MATPTPIITKPPTRIAAASLEDVRILTEYPVTIDGIPVVVTGVARTSAPNWELIGKAHKGHCD